MEEREIYCVCPLRNVPAAFQRFLGPDSGGIERFFGNERTRIADTLSLIVRPDPKLLAGVRRDLRTGAHAACAAMALINPLLLECWIAASGAATIGALRVLDRARGASRKKHAAALLGRWAAHYRLT